MVFWNVTVLGNKDRDFLRKSEKWDVICLLEIWIEEKGKWRKIEKKLSKGYSWEKQWTRRRNKKKRTMGGMLMQVKREREVKRVVTEEGEKGRRNFDEENDDKGREVENYRSIHQWKYKRETEKIKKVDRRRTERKSNNKGNFNAKTGE